MDSIYRAETREELILPSLVNLEKRSSEVQEDHETAVKKPTSFGLILQSKNQKEEYLLILRRFQSTSKAKISVPRR